MSESYAVRDKYVHRIKTLWGLEPEVDGFATEANKRFGCWWGQGSPEGEDAFQQNWAGRLLWLNPPFSKLNEVVEKIAQDGAHAVLVVPDWARRTWHKKAMGMRVADIRFPKYTKLFELDGAPLKGTLWATRVILVCGHRERCTHLLPKPSRETLECRRRPKWSCSTSRTTLFFCTHHIGCWTCSPEQVRWARYTEKKGLRWCLWTVTPGGEPPTPWM